MRIPAQLLARLDAADVNALVAFMLKVEERLPQIYDENVMDHQESRGDDGTLFGLKIYKHLRYAVMQDVEDLDGVAFVEDNGAYYIAIGPLRIRLDSLGHFVYEDVMHTFPDSSPTKRAIGHVNSQQLSLPIPQARPVPEPSAYELTRLTAGHFGNPREGLVKWYLGAWTGNANGVGAAWAWIERQDDSGEAEGGGFTPRAPRKPIAPFDQRAADAVVVRPRPTA